MLEIHGVSKRYQSVNALAGIDLNVATGEILVLLGPTGAGKSTTLLCVAGLETISSGHIVINGRDVSHVNPMQRDVAMVFEGLNLLPMLSVKDNIAFPLRSTVHRCDEAEIDRRVSRIAGELHIDQLLLRNVETLSGGEKQRVAIARAIVRQPKLYLLDEPLSALDLKLREQLRLELRQLHELHSSTILYATHDYHGAASIADRIGIINEGRLYQVGTLDELFADPRHRVVGQLLGSPSMAFFSPRLLNAHGGNVHTDATQDRLTAGIWPEDIDVSAVPLSGYHLATVYATDFRGMDKAIQLKLDSHSFRKVVELDFPVRQGDKCWFGINTSRLMWFDTATGERVAGRPVRGRPQ